MLNIVFYGNILLSTEKCPFVQTGQCRWYIIVEIFFNLDFKVRESGTVANSGFNGFIAYFHIYTFIHCQIFFNFSWSSFYFLKLYEFIWFTFIIFPLQVTLNKIALFRYRTR